MTGGDLNEYIGDIGVYQWLVFIVVFLFNLFNTETYHIIFLGAHMPHWCRVPELEDLPYEIQKNMAIPAQSVNRDGFIDEYSSCEMYSLNYSIYNHSDFYTWNSSLMMADEMSIAKCSQWTYDQSQFLSTIVSKVRSLAFAAKQPLLSVILSRSIHLCLSAKLYLTRTGNALADFSEI